MARALLMKPCIIPILRKITRTKESRRLQQSKPFQLCLSEESKRVNVHSHTSVPRANGKIQCDLGCLWCLQLLPCHLFHYRGLQFEQLKHVGFFRSEVIVIQTISSNTWSISQKRFPGYNVTTPTMLHSLQSKGKYLRISACECACSIWAVPEVVSATDSNLYTNYPRSSTACQCLSRPTGTGPEWTLGL